MQKRRQKALEQSERRAPESDGSTGKYVTIKPRNIVTPDNMGLVT